MKFRYLALLAALILLPALNQQAFSYEAMFDKTQVGSIEVKTLPPAKVLVATAPGGDYFGNKKELFTSLFRYIKAHGVAMTTPVEAHMNPGRMVFFLGKRDEAKNLPNEGSIKRMELPKRTVIALGKRGSYTSENFRKAKLELLRWMQKHPEYLPTGDAYAVYWHGPFVPGFLKRFEVHIPLVTSGRDAPVGASRTGWFQESSPRPQDAEPPTMRQ